ncbi:MAG: ATPase, T2SS/T4P/T4SS family [bacterium]
MSNTNSNSKNLASILLARGNITQAQHDEFLKEAEKPNISLTQLIKESGFVQPRDYAEARAELLEIPFMDLQGKQLTDDILSLIPYDVASNYQLVPFDIKNKVMKIAMLDPENFKAIEALEFVTKNSGYDTEIYLTYKDSYEFVIKQYASLKSEIGQALANADIGFSKTKKEKEADKEQIDITERDKELEKVIQEAPISKAVAVILRHAVDGRASDIHIEPMEDESKVRYRVDGVLHSTLKLPKEVHSAIISRIKILSNLRIDEQRVPQDGRFRSIIDGKDIDFRVSTLPIVNGEKVVMRILDKSEGIKSLEDLGLYGRELKIIQESSKTPHGTILVTGPTGSGKSTTLYSVLSILNAEGVNIITLEDPVEYFIPGINQSQIRPEVGLSFASGLRSILRQDPDIIMVGEIRDNETAEMAVHAALTGHLVLSTLHTNNAIGAIPRLIDMDIEPFLLTAALTVVLAQRLVRSICDGCKEEIEIPGNFKSEFEKEIEDIKKVSRKDIKIPKMRMFKGKGCPKCGGQGYKGRIGIFEVLPVTQAIRDLMVTNATEDAIMEKAVEEGFLNMKQNGILKVFQGLTTMEEIIRVTKAEEEDITTNLQEEAKEKPLITQNGGEEATSKEQ